MEMLNRHTGGAKGKNSLTDPTLQPILLCMTRGDTSLTAAAAAAAESLRSCPTLRNPMDGSPPGSPVPGILQQEHWSGLPFPSPMHESEK